MKYLVTNNNRGFSFEQDIYPCYIENDRNWVEIPERRPFVADLVAAGTLISEQDFLAAEKAKAEKRALEKAAEDLAAQKAAAANNVVPDSVAVASAATPGGAAAGRAQQPDSDTESEAEPESSAPPVGERVGSLAELEALLANGENWQLYQEDGHYRVLSTLGYRTVSKSAAERYIEKKAEKAAA